MSLSPGTPLGPYEILSPLGAGGMGEVYRARDTKLGRDVAIKVLPDALSQDKERLARFEREAKLLASLNHSSIAHLYSFEEFEKQRYIVMELVEGETLAEQIARGPIPIGEALPFFIQISEGLEAAHEKGIIHRDLKPANIKITPEGKVKILDFGLAKAFTANDDVSAEMSQSPTLTKGTALGVIMGTAAYMSPEQARGKPVDRRTDIWAFGCCLHEVLTGKSMFAGETVADTLAAVLGKEPDWSPLPAQTPRHVRALLSRALRKDANLRLQHIGDARIELLDTLKEPSDEARVEAPRRLWIFAAVAIAGVVGFLLRAVTTPAPIEPSPLPAVRLTAKLPEGHQLVVQRGREEIPGRYPPVAISRDGSHIAFAARGDDGVSLLYLRALDSLETRALPDTEDAELPFFSADGQWLGYLVGNRVLKAQIDGGVPIAVGSVPLASARGAAWAADGTMVLGGSNSPLVRMNGETGQTESLTQFKSEKENYHGWPFILPDDEHVLFIVHSSIRTDVAVLSLETGEWHRLEQTEDATQPHYLASGHLVFFRPGGLFAAPFNLSQLAIDGPVTSVLADNLVEGWNAGLVHGYFAASPSGSLVFVPGTVDLQQSRLVRVDRTGGAEPLSEAGRHSFTPAVSPDGARLAATDSILTKGSSADVFLYELESESRTRLTPDGGSIFPVWSADGKRVFFSRFGAGGDSDVYWLPSDGSGALEPLLERPFDQHATAASRDGRLLAVFEIHPESGHDLHVMSLDGSVTSHPLIATSASERDASFSPNSRFAAYVSNESGRDEIHVRSVGGGGTKKVVSSNGGRWPRWSPTGKEIFYLRDTTMMVVPVTLEPSFRAGKPVPLFKGNYAGWFDVFPDGEHFSMITFPEADLHELEVVVNWSTELERLAPAEN